jgi:hypothetical protein
LATANIAEMKVGRPMEADNNETRRSRRRNTERGNQLMEQLTCLTIANKFPSVAKRYELFLLEPAH